MGGRKSTLWQHLCGINSFTIFTCIAVLLVRGSRAYWGGSKRMVERHLGFSAYQTNIFSSMDNVARLPCLLIIGFLGDRLNKSRITGVCTIIGGLASIMYCLPYWITPLPEYYREETVSPDAQNMPLNVTKQKSTDVMCRLNGTAPICISGVVDESGNYPAFLCFIFARFFIGVGGAPWATIAYAYLHDSLGVIKVSLYLGIVMLMENLGSISGTLMASYMSSIPITLKDSDIKPGDPRFLGAWWLGFLIYGILILLSAIPLFFFPARIRATDEATEKEEDKKYTKKKSLKDHLKELWTGLKWFFTSPTYWMYVLATTCMVMAGSQFMSAMQRYLEFHFRFPIYQSILFKIPRSASNAIGSMASGVLLTCLHMRIKAQARFLLLVVAIAIVAFASMFAFNCPQLSFQGMKPRADGFGYTIEGNCSTTCGCDMSKSQPVCGSDGRDYYSPCHAGCTGSVETVVGTQFTKCACVPEGVAMERPCPVTCNMLIPYLVAAVVAALAGGFVRVPKANVILSIVPKEMKSFAMGLNAAVYNLLANIPGPLLRGWLTDMTCLIWQFKKCIRGSCKLYDIMALGYVTNGLPLGFYGLAFIFLFLGYILLPTRTSRGKEQGDKMAGDLASDKQDEMADELREYTSIPNQQADTDNTKL